MDWNRFPPLTSLRAFEAAARNLSLSAAGRELNVSHAAVAQQVKALESHLGLRLVQRAGRGIAPTPEGVLLAEQLTESFGQMADAIGGLTAVEAERPLHVTMTPSFAVSWFMPRMQLFRIAHPGVDLVVNPTVEMVDFTSSDCDVAIRFGSGGWQGVEYELLLHSGFVIVAAPELVGEGWQGDPEDLLNFPWLQELGTKEVKVWLAAQGIEMPAKAQITDLPGYMVLTALRNGQGVAAAARVFVEDDLAAGHLVALHEEPDDMAAGYYLVWRTGIQRPALKHFLRWIRGATQEGT
jgi:LysR family glycine cleavage system transcriptional activator